MIQKVWNNFIEILVRPGTILKNIGKRFWIIFKRILKKLWKKALNYFTEILERPGLVYKMCVLATLSPSILEKFPSLINGADMGD